MKLNGYCKRANWLIIGLPLIICLLLLVPTDTLAENVVSLRINSAFAQPGAEVQVPVILENNTGLASLKFSIQYDNEVLTLTNVTFPKNTGTYSSVPEPYAADQVLNFVSPLSAYSKTGTFATLTFLVNENAALNESANILVVYEEEDVFDMGFNNVALSASMGSVYITDGSQGSMTVLPAALTTIAEEAFMNTSFYYVILPETTTAIGSKAFANCNNLKYIYIPEKTTSIADDAFQNVTGLTVYGKSGSYAEFYAGRKGYGFEAQ